MRCSNSCIRTSLKDGAGVIDLVVTFKYGCGYVKVGVVIERFSLRNCHSLPFQFLATQVELSILSRMVSYLVERTEHILLQIKCESLY